ncbi:MAG: hypoxanthine phosphoribosyltransferase [Phycisphaerales bacterium]|nr:hypoxanthine phosphoribosyltransferase [Phycisphaerales bacterium]
MRQDLERVLLTRDEIAARIEELGRSIVQDLGSDSESDGIVLVPVMTGSITFVADLMRQLPLRVRIGLITASSYAGTSTESSGDVVLSDEQFPVELEGRHVLIVDDILDSGNTIRRVRSEIEARSPRSVRTCVLLRKKITSALETPCEYVGFDIENEFVVGYGLDFDDYYRNLPDIGVLRSDVVESARAAADE